MKPKFRIGIIGGMGPLAGVELHRLIIEATDAAVDQDHLEVFLYTNPHIPDRTLSLQDDNGTSYVDEVVRSIHRLELVNVDILVMACMTAHARFDDIQQQIKTPLLNAINLTQRALRNQSKGNRVLLLATNGSLESRVYIQGGDDIGWIIPEGQTQHGVMDVIYGVKARGKDAALVARLRKIIQAFDCDTVVLGCTELGLFFDDLTQHGYQVVDPLRLVAKELVDLSTVWGVHTLSTHLIKPSQVRDKTPILC